jgi:hypothetical protein
MDTANRLVRLSKQLRDLPRHQWNEHLRRFCEELLMQTPSLEPAKIPVERPERHRAALRRP